MPNSPMNRRIFFRIAGAAILAGAALACGARSRHMGEMLGPTPTPTPSARPRPTPRPRATNQAGTAPTRDVTHEPLTRMIDARTPPSMANAIETAERGRRELDSGTTDRAIELLDESIRLAPQLGPAYVLRAKAHLAEGASASARADLDRAAKLSPDPVWMAEIIAVGGAVYEVQGNSDAAVGAYRRALGVYPGNATAQAALRRLGAK
jgi:Tfp pilus assembly protein PilF